MRSVRHTKKFRNTASFLRTPQSIPMYFNLRLVAFTLKRSRHISISFSNNWSTSSLARCKPFSVSLSVKENQCHWLEISGKIWKVYKEGNTPCFRSMFIYLFILSYIYLFAILSIILGGMDEGPSVNLYIIVVKDLANVQDTQKWDLSCQAG